MTETNTRKGDHIRICLEEDVQASTVETGLQDVHFIHRALPETAVDNVNLVIEMFGRRLSAPIIIEAMTGGVDSATEINATLAEAAEALDLAMGVGSQRAAIEDPRLAHTFKIVRKKAPHSFLIANIGAPQIKEYSLNEITSTIDMIEADALAVHFNPLQEAIQPEGSPQYDGLLDKLEEIASSLSIPIIAKETGSGIAMEEAQLLEGVGVKGIDVAGAGGTSWAAVEACRARARGNHPLASLGETFRDWGLPTAISVVEVSQSVDLKVIASGGLRSGVDAAKAIAIGADAAGYAFHLLKPAVEGRVKEVLEGLLQELKTSMFLVGAKSIEELKTTPVIIVGKTAQWLEARGFHPENFARRGKI
ncbi:MAG: type 2 isopentenyl-diphosphate Delta-isomerase [Candidatus Bathyarchaeota archaeon]|nr:type 2 isopentenyl-diphosphate Delta-isomerase [Candidatus Bathyarchaeota archaeon]